jgi:hypothetical protein
MKYFLLLSLLLALLAGQDYPSQNSDRIPDVAAASAELEALPIGDYGPRPALEGDDHYCCSQAESQLPNFRPVPNTHFAPPIANSTTTPYAIRAPPLPTAV